jgi:hypothetical protein
MRDVRQEPTLNSEPDSEECVVRTDVGINESAGRSDSEGGVGWRITGHCSSCRQLPGLVSQQRVVLVSHLFFFILTGSSTR